MRFWSKFRKLRWAWLRDPFLLVLRNLSNWQWTWRMRRCLADLTKPYGRARVIQGLPPQPPSFPMWQIQGREDIILSFPHTAQKGILHGTDAARGASPPSPPHPVLLSTQSLPYLHTNFIVYSKLMSIFYNFGLVTGLKSFPAGDMPEKIPSIYKSQNIPF